MLEIQLNPHDQSTLNALQVCLDELCAKNPSLPKLRAVFSGSIVRLTYQYQQLAAQPSDAQVKARMAKISLELNALVRDVCIEPLDSTKELTLPQINQIALHLSARYGFPEPVGFSNHYHAKLCLNHVSYNVNVENAQKEPQNTIEVKAYHNGQLIFSPNVMVNNTTHEALFTSYIVAIPHLQISLAEFGQRLTQQYWIKGYLSHLAYCLKTSIKPLRHDYRLDEYTAITWANFMQESPLHYAMIKEHLQHKLAQAHPLTQVTAEEFTQFESEVKKTLADVIKRKEQENQSNLKAEKERISRQARLEVERNLKDIIAAMQVKTKKQEEIEAESHRLFTEYWQQRIKEIKDDREELQGLFYRLMTVYNFYLNEKYELEPQFNHDESINHDFKAGEYFGIPEVMCLMDKNDFNYAFVENLRGKIKASIAAVEHARQELKKIAQVIEDEKQAQRHEEEQSRLKKEKQRQELQKSAASSSSVKSDKPDLQTFTPGVEELDNAIANAVLEKFIAHLLLQYAAWGEVIPIGFEKKFTIELTNKFAKIYHTVLKKPEQKAKFISGLKNALLAAKINKMSKEVHVDLLREILPYCEVNLKEYLKKEHNLKAYIANTYHAFLSSKVFLQELGELPEVKDYQDYFLEKMNENALIVMDSFILSHQYNHDEHTCQKLNSAYQQMKKLKLFSKEGSLALSVLAKTGGPPGKLVGFKFTRNGHVIDSDLMKVFYEKGGRRLKKLNETDYKSIFQIVILKILMEKLHEHLAIGAELPTFETVYGYILNYIEELEEINVGDIRIKGVRPCWSQNRSELMQYFTKTRDDLLNISKNFTPHRILAGIFDADPEDANIMRHANKRYMNACKDTNAAFRSIEPGECLLHDIDSARFVMCVTQHIQDLAQAWPQVWSAKKELVAYASMYPPGTKIYFERIMSVLAAIPHEKRKNYKKILPGISKALQDRYGKDDGQMFWKIFDLIYGYYQSLAHTGKAQAATSTPSIVAANFSLPGIDNAALHTTNSNQQTPYSTGLGGAII